MDAPLIWQQLVAQLKKPGQRTIVSNIDQAS